MENGLKTMIMIIVDQVVNTNEKAEMIKAGMVQVLDKIILIMMVNKFYYISNHSYSLQ